MDAGTFRKVAGVIAATVVAMSPAALISLKAHEGTGVVVATTEGLRYKAYADPYLGWGTPTICYGHTLNVKKGDVATQAQCDQYLKEDVAKHCALVQPFPETQGELDAYCSFSFNTGKFKGTTSVQGRYVQGDRWGACMGLLKYYYSNDKPSRGLWERRYSEYNSCVSELPFTNQGRR